MFLRFTRASLFVLGLVILCSVCVFPLCYCLVVSTSAIDCLERLVSETTGNNATSRNHLLCVEWDVTPYTLTHSLTHVHTLNRTASKLT